MSLRIKRGFCLFKIEFNEFQNYKAVTTIFGDGPDALAGVLELENCTMTDGVRLLELLFEPFRLF